MYKIPIFLRKKKQAILGTKLGINAVKVQKRNEKDGFQTKTVFFSGGRSGGFRYAQRKSRFSEPLQGREPKTNH